MQLVRPSRHNLPHVSRPRRAGRTALHAAKGSLTLVGASSAATRLQGLLRLLCNINYKQNNMNDFKIQPYTKKELALFYFPTADPHVAVNRLMSWVNRCKPLHKALLDQGYQKTSKWLSPREVKLITDHLGEP